MASPRYDRAALAAVFAMAQLGSLPVTAVGLGPVVEQSALGRPLRVVIPVISADGETVPGECFKLAPAAQDDDGVPQVLYGRMSLERGADGARLVVTSTRAVHDPVLRLTLQAGCDTTVRREYTLLMDPPPIEVPAAAAETPANAETAAVKAEVPAASARASTRRPGASPRSAPQTGKARTADAARTPSKAAPRARARTAGAKPAATRAASQPRLKLSSAPPSFVPGARESAAGSAATQQEMAAALEAETVVLRQRIVELTAMVEQMQRELKATEAAERSAQSAAPKEALPASTRAQPGASETLASARPTQAEAMPVAAIPLATPSVPATEVPWWQANWPLLASIVGLPLLIAGGLLWRRRQEAARSGRFTPPRIPLDQRGPSTASRSGKTGGGATRRDLHALRNAPAGVADAAPATPMRSGGSEPRAATSDPAGSLAVSELSQVTEEARVYVALGHVDRAIDVLTRHLAQAPRSMPAAWLMLLGLYHAKGRRQDFRNVAQEFHVRCNVQAPSWEGFTDAEASGAGLDAFPHVQKKIVAVWRKPGCRAYLHRLLVENRDGRRMGFPIAAYADILMLLQVLDAPAVDIDSDLAGSGRLDSSSASAMASVPPATPPT